MFFVLFVSTYQIRHKRWYATFSAFVGRENVGNPTCVRVGQWQVCVVPGDAGASSSQKSRLTLAAAEIIPHD